MLQIDALQLKHQSWHSATSLVEHFFTSYMNYVALINGASSMKKVFRGRDELVPFETLLDPFAPDNCR